MKSLLGIALGPKGSARERYAQAMALYAAGSLSLAELEAYRIASAHDRLPPDLFLADRNPPLSEPDGAAR
jgi:hypothetical protein